MILRKIAPDDLARYQAQIAEAKATEPPIEEKQTAEQDEKRRRRRQIYQQYAAKFAGKSDRECDLLVVRQLMSELLTERDGKRLSDNEIGKVGSILLQGPVAQELKQTQGKDAGVEYAMGVLAKAQKVVEKAQRRSRDIDPDALARYQAQVAEAKATEPPIKKKQAAEQDEKRRRRRQIYQQYAAKFAGKSVYECDRPVVRQLMSELLTERDGQRLSDDEITKVGSILLHGPVAQELK